MRFSITHYLKKISTFLLPYRCLFCGAVAQEARDLCHACQEELPFWQYGCRRCAEPFAYPGESLLCGQCLRHPPAFDAVITAFLYQSPIAECILQLKFKEKIIYAHLLGELLADKIAAYYQEQPWPTMIVPVPLHPNRLKQRGFNQAIEIARPLARRFRLPINITHCKRHKKTAAQAMLSAEERHQNIKNAFSITPLPDTHIAVIDDVMTTGTTLQEFCLALKKSGVKKIDVWCCARPILCIMPNVFSKN